MFTPRFWQNLLLGFLVILLALGLWWAVRAGIRSGQSATILKNVAALNTGLGYFFADQNRYPTALEFQDKNIMLNYVSPFPPENLASGLCQETYRYSSPTARTFELAFCLPTGKEGFAAGWNKITQ